MAVRPFAQCLFLGLVLATGPRAQGAEETRHQTGRLSFRIKTWTTDDGLPQHGISCLKQTRDGYLWIGTWYGLARFDGNRFRTFDKFNTPALVNDTINSLAEDRRGDLWIGTGGGLVRYREGRFQRLTEEDGLFRPQVWRLAPHPREGIWLQSEHRIFYLRADEFSPVLDAQELPFGSIIGLEQGERGRLNILFEAAWLEVDEAGQMRTNFVRNPAVPPWVSAHLGRIPGECWVASAAGVGLLRRTAERLIRIEQGGTRQANFVQEDLSGNVWVNGLRPILYQRAMADWQDVELEMLGKIACLEQDFEGCNWLGTERGLVQVRTTPARSYTRRDGVSDNNVWCVCEGTDGTIWLGSDQGVSAIRTEGQVVNWTNSEPALGHCVRSLLANRSGGVFIAKTDEGIYELQDGIFTKRLPYKALEGLPTGLFEDSLGRLAIATSRSVLLCRGTELDQPLRQEATYEVPEVRAMAEDPDGTVWLATKGRGLAQLKQGKLRFLTERDGLSNSNVWGIHRDSEGALWLATDNGVTRFFKGKLTPITRKNGLLENVVNCVLEDDLGFFWLSGLHGIYWVEGTQLRAVAEGRARSMLCRALGTADGMESPETNGETQPSGCKARDGRLWFPTIRGVVVVDPRELNLHEAPPRVMLEYVKANDNIIFGTAEAGFSTRLEEKETAHRIAVGQGKVIEFKYTANEFVAPERVRFRYRLWGADKDWRQETTERSASYFNLRPGRYHFEVMAGNHHNLWSKTSEPFEFYLEPSFWQTWTFYGLCGAGAVGIAAAILVYRLRWQRRLLKIEEQKALAVERTRIARDLHDDLGTALTGLALELDVIGREARTVPRLSSRLNDAARRVRGLAERMREVVWTVNPRCDTVSSLADFLEQQANQFLHGSDTTVRLEFPEDIPPLPLGAEARHQLALSIREALANIVRHAAATEVVLGLSISNGTLTVQIRDNGQGFRPVPSPGHGLENMRARLEQAGGVFELVSKPGAGTILDFRLPLDKGAMNNHEIVHS